MVNNIFEAWENAKIEAGCKRCSDSDFAAICCLRPLGQKVAKNAFSLHPSVEHLVCGLFERHIGTLPPKKVPKRKTCQVLRKLVICDYYSACRITDTSVFFLFLFFFGVEIWAAAHGLYRCAVYRLLSDPMSTRLLNSISSRICRQNTQFNMYTTTSKQQEGCTFKDSHPKCFITTNFDKFHREAFARAVNRGDVLTACFRDIQSQRSIRMEFVIIMILFEKKVYRLLYGSISLSPHSEKI